ncbi:hypothetical protein B566_EDAN008191 [Ephemera danica]|nr:hypothetical protein B566_EDAN008191 [Ephemera danica]
MKVNPDLDNERKKCSFNVTELTHFLDGGIGKYRARKKRVGHTMNYAAVIAQLYTNGQCHGVHTFMVQLRDEKTYQPLTVVFNMIFHVAQALTIAVRYSAVRRQSEMKPGEREPQILDYQTQQYKLLPYLHAMTCCLKAICTSDATEAIDRARLACGGHGYMTSSNLHPNYAVISAAQTFEGENTVLLLQTARALIKAWLRVQEQLP